MSFVEIYLVAGPGRKVETGLDGTDKGLDTLDLDTILRIYDCLYTHINSPMPSVLMSTLIRHRLLRNLYYYYYYHLLILYTIQLFQVYAT